MSAHVELKQAIIPLYSSAISTALFGAVLTFQNTIGFVHFESSGAAATELARTLV